MAAKLEVKIDKKQGTVTVNTNGRYDFAGILKGSRKFEDGAWTYTGMSTEQADVIQKVAELLNQWEDLRKPEQAPVEKVKKPASKPVASDANSDGVKPTEEMPAWAKQLMEANALLSKKLNQLEKAGTKKPATK